MGSLAWQITTVELSTLGRLTGVGNCSNHTRSSHQCRVAHLKQMIQKTSSVRLPVIGTNLNNEMSFSGIALTSHWTLSLAIPSMSSFLTRSDCSLDKLLIAT